VTLSHTRYSKFQMGCCCYLFDVPFSWAISARATYLDGIKRSIGDKIWVGRRFRESAIKDGAGEGEIAIVDSEIHDLIRKYKAVDAEINSLRYRKKEPKSRITPEMVIRAREFPMEELIEVSKKGNIHCPFHEDRNPSASIKNNRLHCFACGKTWNPIDFLMEREGLKFQEAIHRLN
jgi:hypothetical protein